MPNDYFNHTDRALENSLITEEQYNDNMDAVAAGFDLIPDSTTLNNSSIPLALSTSVSNVYTVTISDILSYTDGYTFRIQADASSTGPVYIQINALGNILLRRDNLATSVAGDFTANSVYTITYSSTNSSFIMQSAPTAIVDEVTDVQEELNTRFLGASATEPTTDLNGDPLSEGSIYTNSVTNISYVYVGSSWNTIDTYIKHVGDIEPSEPYNGMEWFDTSTGIDYTYYIDVDSGQWLQQTVQVPTVSIVDYAFTTTTITVDSSADVTNYVNFIDATSNDVTVTLPTAVGKQGIVVNCKRVDSSSNTVTVDTTGVETIDDFEGTLLETNQNLQVISDNTNWRIL